MKARIAVAGALLATSWAAGAAEITATATLASEYDFRGITQTQGEPAFQLGLNYAAESGIYMGYAGGDAEETFGWDVGAIYYTYPNATGGNTPEVYAGISKGVASFKAWYSWDYADSGDTA